MIQLAFATSTNYPGLETDLVNVPVLLAVHNIQVTPTIWDSDSDWRKFDAVLIRTTWDYWDKTPAFMDWLARLEKLGISVFNHPDTIRWNADKRYLLELEARGVTILPSVLIEQDEQADLAAIMRDRGWTKAVIKPTISAGARNTHVVDVTQSDLLNDLLTRYSMLINPYREEIETIGEVSLLYFNGRFSHAVSKRPKSGDFRVQPQHGGQTVLFDPPEALIDTCRDIVEKIDPVPVYARVDGLALPGRFELMELELIEPALFVALHPSAATNVANALIEALRAEDLL